MFVYTSQLSAFNFQAFLLKGALKILTAVIQYCWSNIVLLKTAYHAQFKLINVPYILKLDNRESMDHVLLIHQLNSRKLNGGQNYLG